MRMESHPAGEPFPRPHTLWLPEEPPRAVLMVVHGMTEHMGRYETLAQTLTARGIVVAGFDLRGHGRNPGDRRLASFGPDGWEASRLELQQFDALLAARFPGLPRVALGFSLGSFLLREQLCHGLGDLAGVALLGTGWQPSPVLSVMRAVVKTQLPRAGADGTTPLIESLSFGSYNRRFRPNRTRADWLCADTAQLDAYLADPLCREGISAGLFDQLLGAMQRTGGRDACRGWDPARPVLLLSGQDDPVGDFGRGVQTLRRRMERAGLRRVTLQLLPDARHDLLHEEATAAAQARQCLCDWLEDVLTTA